MTTSVGISGGTYYAAATLGNRFNVAAGASEEANVAAVIEKSVEFMAGIADDVRDGWNLRVREPQPYVLYPARTLLTGQNATSQATMPGIGDGLGDVVMAVSDSTSGELLHIRKAFNLTSDVYAARLAVAVYSTIQDKLANKYADVFLSKQEESATATKDLSAYRLAPKA